MGDVGASVSKLLCGCERWFLGLYPEWDCRPVLLTACVDLQALQQRVSSWAPVLTHLSLFLKSDVLFWKARVHSVQNINLGVNAGADQLLTIVNRSPHPLVPDAAAGALRRCSAALVCIHCRLWRPSTFSNVYWPFK